MAQTPEQKGAAELREIRADSRKYYWIVALFSFVVNMLMLTGPLYMLHVYDDVLGSRSLETLVALTIIVAFLYAMMGLMDYTRGRIMARVGARFQAKLDRRVFDAVVRKAAVAPDENTATGLRDLESIQRLITSPVLMAFFDLPWTPVFLAGIALFHPWLGLLALGGGSLLIFITFINQMLTRNLLTQSNIATYKAEMISDQIRNEAELIRSLGMTGATFSRWQVARGESLSTQISSTDVTGVFSSLTKSFRMFLQSAMLGLGAYLVLQNELTAGAMIAGSILLGRALAPVEMLLNQWPLVQRGRKGWESLSQLLGEVPPEPPRTPLPKPRALLEAQNLTIIPPGEQQASLRAVNFVLKPGQAMGVIGPSGAGKSTLARAVTAVWRPAGGKVRLDGASLDNYDPDALGKHIGYLPQRVQLFDGTIAENIARLAVEPDSAQVVAAAKKAAAHEMILSLPDGYDTRVAAIGGRLSGGQIQRIGLARAMYGDPAILVLDEPNSNLDNEGSQALNVAIRAMKKEGKSTIIMAHRPSAIQECEVLLVLDKGQRVAFGPREEVLKQTVQNHSTITKAQGKAGGVS